MTLFPSQYVKPWIRCTVCGLLTAWYHPCACHIRPRAPQREHPPLAWIALFLLASWGLLSAGLWLVNLVWHGRAAACFIP